MKDKIGTSHNVVLFTSFPINILYEASSFCFKLLVEEDSVVKLPLIFFCYYKLYHHSFTYICMYTFDMYAHAHL